MLSRFAWRDTTRVIEADTENETSFLFLYSGRIHRLAGGATYYDPPPPRAYPCRGRGRSLRRPTSALEVRPYTFPRRQVIPNRRQTKDAVRAELPRVHCRRLLRRVDHDTDSCTLPARCVLCVQQGGFSSLLYKVEPSPE